MNVFEVIQKQKGKIPLFCYLNGAVKRFFAAPLDFINFQ
jgi:hypothetical protein